MTTPESSIQIPNGNRLKFWLALIPIITLALSFGGGYGGKKFAEGEMNNRIVVLESQAKRTDDVLDKISDRYVTLSEFQRRMEDLERQRKIQDGYLLDVMTGIKTDVEKIRDRR